MERTVCTTILLLAAAGAVGCSKSISLDDESTDTASDTGTDADAETDTDTDTGAADSDIAIPVSNRSEEIVYLDIYGTVRGERLTDGGPEPVVLEPGMCDWSCDVLAEAGFCFVPCIVWPGAYAVLPGDTYAVSWDGLLRQDVPGECPCYETVAPPPGAYRLIVDVYREFTCFEDPCPAPVKSGFLSDRMVSGEAISVETAFSVPWNGGPLWVEVEP